MPVLETILSCLIILGQVMRIYQNKSAQVVLQIFVVVDHNQLV
jgi:hypothetical protein